MSVEGGSFLVPNVWNVWCEPLERGTFAMHISKERNEKVERTRHKG
jgi:hypothetical protein